MKTLGIKIVALILMICAMSAIAFPQAINVPQKVQAAFSAKFPQIQQKNWKMENGQYIASFAWDMKDCQVTYAADGSWVSTMVIDRNQLRHLTPVMRDELRNSIYTSYHLDPSKNLQNPTIDMFLLSVDRDNGNIAAYEDAGSVDIATLYYHQAGKPNK
ncbi:MAG: hypothetical protein JO080_11745 [Mucilaginibacter sp.]|nr:hypothetical protein [Mucilaginibacter sp.]